MRVASFVTSHGFGHAGRASAVLDALHRQRPGLTADIYTAVPDGFLRSSLAASYRRVEIASDRGMQQAGPFRSDPAATARAVAEFLDRIEHAATELGRELRRAGCAVVLCDIDPLGILAAAAAGVPSVLVENFRWDWIYRTIPGAQASLRASGERIGEIYRRADLHLQVAPACDRVEGAVQVALPIARAARSSREQVRRDLGVDPAARVVLVTTGGIRGSHDELEHLRAHPDVTFIVTGAAHGGRDRNVVRLAYERPLYLPDLLRASDAVVAKIGYSTVAEAWRESVPLMGVRRDDWPESPVVARWVAENCAGFMVDESTFTSGAWIDRVDELLRVPRRAPHQRAGQDEVADRILVLLGSRQPQV